MRPTTQTLTVSGAAGDIDCALDLPPGRPRAIALIAHPHPLHGGARDNKVVQTIARALIDLGCNCWRPDFRGVGRSGGTHDAGVGETDDLLRVLDAAAAHPSAQALATPVPLVLAGFSFGSFVQSRVAARLDPARFALAPMLMVGTAAARFAVESIPADSIVIHGETDDVVPLTDVMNWARPQVLPVVVLPDTGHFFHGRLGLLKRVILRELAGTFAGTFAGAFAAPSPRQSDEAASR
ncbi:MAG: alpha/beta hydrolase [Lautropia sp.]